MNKPAFNFSKAQVKAINKELKSLDTFQEKLSYAIIKRNQDRFAKLCGFTTNDSITNSELELYEELNKEPEDDMEAQRLTTLGEMFARVLKTNSTYEVAA
jgi:hypothetical protein